MASPSLLRISCRVDELLVSIMALYTTAKDKMEINTRLGVDILAIGNSLLLRNPDYLKKKLLFSPEA